MRHKDKQSGSELKSRVSIPVELPPSLPSRGPGALAPTRGFRPGERLGELAIALVGVAATGATFFAIRNAEYQRIRLGFERETVRSVDIVKQQLVASTDVVTGYASHLGIVAGDRCRSHSYAREVLARHPALRGLSWNTILAGPERATFELLQQRERPTFRISERNPSGAFIAASERERYVVVTCIEPLAGNEKAIGFNLTSDPVRAEAIERTLATRAPAVTSRIRLVQEPAKAASVLLLQAVVDHTTGDTVGCVSAVLRIDDVFERTLGTLQPGSSIGLYDDGSPSKAALYLLGEESGGEGGLAIDLPINVANRPWRLRGEISRTEIFGRMSMVPWAWLPAGLLLTWFAVRTRRSERASRALLRNVLPAHIADRLEGGPHSLADRHEQVTVLFTDIVNFTGIAARLGADDLVRSLDELFSSFDRITDEYGLEKIKTIGDSYMAVAGLDDQGDSTFRSVRAAQAMVVQAERLGLPVRIGMHVGPVVAGVLGRRRLAYDLWGDTVNVASRMESSGLPGRIVLSDEAYVAVAGRIRCERREALAMKGLGSRLSWIVLIESGLDMKTGG